MNSLNFLNNRFSMGVNPYSQTVNAGFSQFNIGFASLLGTQNSFTPQYSSTLMQSLFGSSYGSNPLSQLFGGLGATGLGFDSGYGNYGNYGYGAGGYGNYGSSGYSFGGYGASPQYQCPPPPQNCNCSPCQDFNFGQQCHPSQRDYGCQQASNSRGSGQLQQEAEGKPIAYTTSGGYTVAVDGHTINITDPNGKNTVKTWGDPHENVNGQHVSDWQEKQRTIVLDDGTKITMSADNPKGVVESMSIYDGRQSVSIDNNNNKVTNQSFNPWETRNAEQSQYDGSVAYLQTGNDGSLNFANYYTQDQDFNISRDYQLLATVDSGGKVTDHFDDPTHKNT